MTKRIVIIGGGMAGLCLAQELIALGYPASELVLSHAPLSGVTGSTNPGGLLNPVPGASLNPKPGTLKAFQYTLDWIHRLPTKIRETCTTDLKLFRPYSLSIQPGRRLFKSFQESQNEIGQVVDIRHVSTEELEAFYPHLHNCDGAIEFGSAATVPMDSVCTYLQETLQRSGANLIHERVQSLIEFPSHWQLQTATQTVEADTVVFACGSGLLSFFPQLPLRATSGHLARIRMPDDFPRTHAISGRGHLCPMADGTWVLGATYHQEHTSEPQSQDELRNILLSKIGHWVQSTQNAQWIESWRGVRAVISPEKQPLIGAIPGQRRLLTLSGFASRGLQWAPYCAQQLAKHLMGAPLDLPQNIQSDRLDISNWKMEPKPELSPNLAKLGF